MAKKSRKGTYLLIGILLLAAIGFVYFTDFSNDGSVVSINLYDITGNLVDTFNNFIPMAFLVEGIEVTEIGFVLAWSTDDPDVTSTTQQLAVTVKWLGGEPDMPRVEEDFYRYDNTGGANGEWEYRVRLDSICANVPSGTAKFYIHCYGRVDFYVDGDQLTARSGTIEIELEKTHYTYEVNFGTIG